TRSVSALATEAARPAASMAAATAAPLSAVFNRLISSLLSWCVGPVRPAFSDASDPAPIDDEVLGRAHAAVVGCQEQHHAGDVRRGEAVRQALPLRDLALALGRQPQLDLALGHHPARQDAVDANALGP